MPRNRAIDIHQEASARRSLFTELEALYIRRYVLDKVIRRLEEYQRCRRVGREMPLIGIDEFLRSSNQ